MTIYKLMGMEFELLKKNLTDRPIPEKQGSYGETKTFSKSA